MAPENYHFSGYATRNDTECADGRVIRKDAFKGCDGITVPLVWAHQHDSIDNVLGHAYLENRDDGVYAYCTCNDTARGRDAREAVRNGDIRAMSIYANKLKQLGSDVMHGVIREVSLVLAPANPGAYIDSILCHDYSEDGDGEMSQEAYICFPDTIVLAHSDDMDDYDDEYDEDDYDEEDYEDDTSYDLSEFYHSDDMDDYDDEYDEDDYDEEDYEDDTSYDLSEFYHSDDMSSVADVLATLNPTQMDVVTALIAEALNQND